jgi:hypothetical protein
MCHHTMLPKTSCLLLRTTPLCHWPMPTCTPGPLVQKTSSTGRVRSVPHSRTCLQFPILEQHAKRSFPARHQAQPGVKGGHENNCHTCDFAACLAQQQSTATRLAVCLQCADGLSPTLSPPPQLSLSLCGRLYLGKTPLKCLRHLMWRSAVAQQRQKRWCM